MEFDEKSKAQNSPSKFIKSINHGQYFHCGSLKTPGCEGIDGVSILLPPDFMNRLARDVVRMTEGEIHGIR